MVEIENTGVRAKLRMQLILIQSLLSHGPPRIASVSLGLKIFREECEVSRLELRVTERVIGPS